MPTKTSPSKPKSNAAPGKITVHAIIHAAAISYGIVFMHPFEDGNGRVLRFIIHNILFLRGEIPNGLMFPVSAAMLKNPALYDHSLSAFSNTLMRLSDFVTLTIEHELVEELYFLANYDKAKQAIQEIVDMPDRPY